MGKGVAHGDRPMGLPWRSSRTEAPALERAPTYTWRACAPRGSGLMAEPLPRSLACGSARKWIPRGDDEEIRTSLWAVRGGCRRAWAVTSSGRPLPSRPHGAAQVGHVHVMCTHHVLVLVLVDADMCNRHVQSPCACGGEPTAERGAWLGGSVQEDHWGGGRANALCRMPSPPPWRLARREESVCRHTHTFCTSVACAAALWAIVWWWPRTRGCMRAARRGAAMGVVTSGAVCARVGGTKREMRVLRSTQCICREGPPGTFSR